MADIREVKRGRPPLADEVSRIPAVTVPASLHDAVVREAARRDVPVAQIVREALISDLNNRQEAKAS